MASFSALPVAFTVSADLERGFGDEPEIVAETIRLAADAGLVGCTIEDATGNQDKPLYGFTLAVERIAAAAQAARQLGFIVFNPEFRTTNGIGTAKTVSPSNGSTK